VRYYWYILVPYLKVKIGPTIFYIDAVMEIIVLPEIVHVKNCGGLEDIFEGENWSHNH
jgi:hypothetical protein